MTAVRQNKTLLMTLALMIAICVGLWLMRTHVPSLNADVREIRSENGVWDLRDVNFSSGLVKLSGNGETVPNALLSPAEFDAYEGQVIYGGYKDARVSTTRLRILLPDDGIYTIVGTSVDYAERIFINGVWRQNVGTVGLSKETSSPASVYLTLEASAQGGALEIVRQNSNFVHWSLRNPVEVMIGSAAVMRQFTALETDQAGFVMGMLFALFVSHALLYAIMGRYRANLYFALLCLAWCLRTGVTGVMILPAWFPQVSWYVYLRMEYSLVAVAAVCIVKIISAVFPAALPGWAIRVVMVFSSVYFALCLLLPAMPLTYLWIPCAAVYIALILYVVVRLIRSVLSGLNAHTIEVEQWIMLASLFFLFFTAIRDVVFYIGFAKIGMLNDIGFLVFGLSQMAANFYGTKREMDRVHKIEQEARLEAETLRRVGALKEEFLYNLSHELQMPITVISGFAQLTGQMMEDRTPDRDAILENMRRLEDEAGRMERMVTQLLDVAAVESGSFVLHKERLDMTQLLQTVTDIHFPVMNHNQNVCQVDTTQPLWVCGDRERLLEVLLNLLSNAVKHTKSGTISMAVAGAEDMAVVTVRDTGCGIPPALLPELFKRFSKDQVTGNNGLGLYICMQIIKAHGGTIHMDSTPDSGTLVRFTVPLWKEGPR